MKTMNKFTYSAFLEFGLIRSLIMLAALAIGASVVNAAPGDIFVSANNVIYKFAPDGTRSTFTTEVSRPNGLAFDSAANLFAGDNGTIYKFAPDGTRSTFATGVAGPYALAFDSAGTLFDADGSSGTIYKFASDG